MRRRTILVLSSLLLAAGCNLDFSASVNVQPSDVTMTPTPPELTPEATLDIAAQVAALEPTVAALQLTVAAQIMPVIPPTEPSPPASAVVITSAPTQAPACTPRTDFEAYQVKWGDTVGYIAKHRRLTVDDIVAANCLTNPDLIFPGQTLYLPPITGAVSSTPGQTTRPPLSNNGSFQLLVTPNQGINANGALQLQAGTSVKLQWAQLSSEIPVSVSFYYAPNVDGLDPTLIGTSTPDANWALTWTVPPDVNARLSAVAFLDDGSPRQPPESVVVVSQP